MEEYTSVQMPVKSSDRRGNALKGPRGDRSGRDGNFGCRRILNADREEIASTEEGTSNSIHLI